MSMIHTGNKISYDDLIERQIKFGNYHESDGEDFDQEDEGVEEELPEVDGEDFGEELEEFDEEEYYEEDEDDEDEEDEEDVEDEEEI